MGGLLAFIYGLICYAIFLVTFIYSIGFVGNLIVPKSIDSGAAGDGVTSLLVNLALMSVFAVQHSLMARPGFKRVWTKWVPEAIERSTYVLFSSLALILLFVFWQPMPTVIWDFSATPLAFVMTGLFWLGWAIVLGSTFMISHFDLLGLQQVFRRLMNRPISSSEKATLITPALYRLVRHPLMLGFLIAFWATPKMSVGHLLFAAIVSIYTVLALILEERDLIAEFGEAYEDYRSRVPMLLPFTKRKRKNPHKETSAPHAD